MCSENLNFISQTLKNVFCIEAEKIRSHPNENSNPDTMDKKMKNTCHLIATSCKPYVRTRFASGFPSQTT